MNERFKIAIKSLLQPDLLALYLVFIVLLNVFPYFPKQQSANELSRLYLAMSMVDHLDVSISKAVDQYGFIGDLSYTNGQYYSDKPPGTAFVVAPVLHLKRLVDSDADLKGDLRLARLLTAVIPTLFLLVLIRREMIKFGVSTTSRTIVIATFGLGSHIFTYGVLFYGHQLIAVLLYLVWFTITDKDLSPRRAFVAGFLGGLCFSVEFQTAIYLLPLVVVAIKRANPKARTILAAFLGALPLLLAIGVYHDIAFGSPFKTGYNYVDNPYFAEIHSMGFMGVSYPKYYNFMGSLFWPSKGIFFWSPFLIFGVLGLRYYGLTKQERRLRIAMVALPILFVSSMVYYYGGATVSQRHLTPIIPFLMTPAGMFLDRSSKGRLFAPALAAISVGYTGLATMTFPHLPDTIANPYHEVVVPLAKQGYLVETNLEAVFSSSAFLIAVAVIFLLLLVHTINSWTVRPRRAALAAVILVVLPLLFFDVTSRVFRRPAEDQAKSMEYFEDQFWNAKSPPE